MLKGFNNSQVSRKFAANSIGHYFFIQKWVELTSNYSIFSYQIRFKNARSLLIEIMDVIKLLDSSDIHINNLISVIEEAKAMLNRDLCLKKHQRQMYYALITGLGNFKPKDKSSLMRLSAQISIFLKTVDQENYCSWLVSDLKESIDEACTERFKTDEKGNQIDWYDRIYLYSELLASELTNKGWTSPGLYAALMQTLTDQHSTFDNAWARFINKLINDKETYVFFFKCNYPNSNEISILPEGLNIISGNDVINEFPRAVEHVIEGHVYVRYECEHYDYRYMHQVAYYKIKQLNAIYSFYKEDFNIISNDKCILGFSNGKVIPIEGNIRTESNVDFIKLNNYIRTIQPLLCDDQLNEISRKRIADALTQYSNSLDSISPDKKYVSLWSCIETLLNTGQYSNIIEHVKRTVPAVMCSRYAYKILSNLLCDIGRCGINIDLNGVDIKTKDPEYNDVNNILEIIKKNALFDELYSKCSDNELLKHRLDRLRKNFSSNEDLHEFILNNYNNVVWNVQRLYRYRNQIVHYSDVIGNISILCSHLNYYIRSIISEVGFRFYQQDSVKFSSLIEIYSYLNDNYLVLMSFLDPKGQRKNKIPYSNEFILKSSINQ
jgi:hypothetical protein